MDTKTLTLLDAMKGLHNNDFSSVELTQACLDRIKERNDAINAYITVDEEGALDAAKAADEKLSAGKGHELTGIPFGVKDAICTKGVRSTGAAKILDQYIPTHDATVIAKLKEKGAVLLGKQNCDAFGHGASNENSMYGPVKNPFDETKVAGGSSGGSAAALADGQCIFSVAEDTGGSIRQPASFCGVFGMRPTYGRNSRYGIMPMASSLDVVGPMAKSVEDIAMIMEVMAGHDEKDATTFSDVVPDYSKLLEENISGLKVGVPREYFEIAALDEEVQQRVDEATAQLEKLGCEIVEVSLPHTAYAVPTYYILVPSEDSSNLARLDGIRYGQQVEDVHSLREVYDVSRSVGFPAEVKRRIMIGTYALSAGYIDAYYKKAQKVRTKIKQDFEAAFATVDVLVTPTSPFPAFGLGEKKDDVLSMYLADIFVSPAALAGVPALSMPVGNTSAGLPVGLQMIGPQLGETRLLQAAYHLEQAML